jgi:ATP phosphoribosyltransferase
MESVAEIDDDGTSLADLSHAGGDQASAATSVYSYIDANLMDDQSIAQNSYQGMYGAGMAGSDLMDDQSLQSMSRGVPRVVTGTITTVLAPRAEPIASIRS